MREQAAGAPESLARNACTDVVIADAGGFEALTRLLSSESAGVQQRAAGALQNATSREGREPHLRAVASAAAGGIPLLTALLVSPVVQVQENAVCLLHHMSMCNETFLAAITSAGAVHRLVRLLQSSSVQP